MQFSEARNCPMFHKCQTFKSRGFGEAVQTKLTTLQVHGGVLPSKFTENKSSQHSTHCSGVHQDPEGEGTPAYPSTRADQGAALTLKARHASPTCDGRRESSVQHQPSWALPPLAFSMGLTEGGQTQTGSAWQEIPQQASGCPPSSLPADSADCVLASFPIAQTTTRPPTES